jgi:hypothetical protein
MTVLKMKRSLRIASLATLTLATALAGGQTPLVEGAGVPAQKPSAVSFLYPEQLEIPVGKPVKVILHFRVAQGLHINSHTPTADELIPTTFTIPGGARVQLISVAYPPGADYTLPLDPAMKLSVYSGEFTIETHLRAVAAGNHLLEASLRYQACDNNACMPPKTIPVVIDVIGQ